MIEPNKLVGFLWAEYVFLTKLAKSASTCIALSVETREDFVSRVNGKIACCLTKFFCPSN
jgi:hypothetical protein